MQNRISIDGYSDVQPTQFDWSFETTSTADSARAMSGTAYITPMFTVEAFNVIFTKLTPQQCRTLLTAIVQRPGKTYFSLHYYSPYYGEWRTGQFYVGQGTLKVKTLREGKETMQTLSCNFIGKDKLV